MLQFQSLLSWISRFGNFVLQYEVNTNRFQSLLSWISRFGLDIRVLALAALLGFNPCCLGLAVLACAGW